jgi:hypothetical protein
MLLAAPSVLVTAPSVVSGEEPRDALVPDSEEHKLLTLQVNLKAIELLAHSVLHYDRTKSEAYNIAAKRLKVATMVCGVASVGLGASILVFATAGAAVPIAITTIALVSSSTGATTGFLSERAEAKRDGTSTTAKNSMMKVMSLAKKLVSNGNEGRTLHLVDGSTGPAFGAVMPVVEAVVAGVEVGLAPTGIGLAVGIKNMVGFKGTHKEYLEYSKETKRMLQNSKFFEDFFDFEWLENQIEGLGKSGVEIGVPKTEDDWLEMAEYLEQFVKVLAKMKKDHKTPIGPPYMFPGGEPAMKDALFVSDQIAKVLQRLTNAITKCKTKFKLPPEKEVAWKDRRINDWLHDCQVIECYSTVADCGCRRKYTRSGGRRDLLAHERTEEEKRKLKRVKKQKQLYPARNL